MKSGHVVERVIGGRAFAVRVIDGLQHAGAVQMDGEIIVGRCETPEATEAAIAAAIRKASLAVEKIP